MNNAENLQYSKVIRKAVPADIRAIVELGVEALELNPQPGMVIDRLKVKEVATDCVSSARHFAMVAEVNGMVEGAVCAFANENLFHKRQQASVVQFYTRAPGEGIKLLRELLKWYQSRPALRALYFTLEHRADPRIIKMLRRLGLQTELPIMAIFKAGKL